MLMYVIVVNKSQEILLNVRRLSCIFFSTTTQEIRLRRRVDVHSTTSYTITNRRRNLFFVHCWQI